MLTLLFAIMQMFITLCVPVFLTLLLNYDCCIITQYSRSLLYPNSCIIIMLLDLGKPSMYAQKFIIAMLKYCPDTV